MQSSPTSGTEINSNKMEAGTCGSCCFCGIKCSVALWTGKDLLTKKASYKLVWKKMLNTALFTLKNYKEEFKATEL